MHGKQQQQCKRGVRLTPQTLEVAQARPASAALPLAYTPQKGFDRLPRAWIGHLEGTASVAFFDAP